MSRTRKVDQRYQLPSIIDPSRKCLKIYIPDEENHLKAFWATLNELANAWAWEWDGNKTGSAVAYIWNEIINEASDRYIYDNGGCFMYMLRQSPTDDCILEQSVDDGQTWTTAFDFGLCRPTQTNITYETNISVQVGNILNDYSASGGDITNVFNILVYGVSPERNTQLDEALCYAIGAFVRSISSMAYDLTGSNTSIADSMSWILEQASEISATIDDYFNPISLLTWQINKLKSLLDGFLTCANSAYVDEFAIKEVACCMYDTLKGKTSGSIQQTEFSTALSGCTFTGNALCIANAVSQMIGNEDAYLMFANVWNEASQRAIYSGISPCICTDEWCKVLDLTNCALSEPLYYATAGTMSACFSGLGWKGNDPSNQDRNYYGVDFGSSYNITSIVLTSSINSFDANVRFITGLDSPTSGQVCNTQAQAQFDHSCTYDRLVEQIWFGFERSGADRTPILGLYLEQVKISGIGDIPPSLQALPDCT